MSMTLLAAADDVTVVSHPDTGTPNTHYAGNRAPLAPSPFIKLPLTAIEPRGWLRKQIELQASGFHGHLAEISSFLKADDNAWLSPTGEGRNGWEEVPYWLKGFGDAAYLLHNETQIQEARRWIEGALRSQREDGYFGPRPGLKATVSSTEGKYDLWPNMVMLNCLQSYYEYSGDRRVIDLMTRYFRWELAVPESEYLPPYWQQIRAGDNLWSIYWLYNRIGEPWLLELAAKTHRRTANFTDGIPDWHNVNLSQAFGGPAFYWMQSKDPRHLAAAERNWQTIRDTYGQVPGGMFGGDENCRPGYADPRQAVETCGMVEMMYSHERLLTASGNPIWADRCEDVAFNSLPASQTADFKALRYLTAPNLIRSDRQNKAPGYQNGGPMLHFNPHSHRCCQHNVGHGWPYFAEHTWMATPGNGLAATLYAPSQVKARVSDGTEVTITEATRYPFEETVEFALSSSKPVRFPLFLRVPGWCTQAPQLEINGRAVAVPARPLAFVRIDREWRTGDRVKLEFPTEVTLRTWTKNHDSVSVDRGPLTYSLLIGERVERRGGTDAWPAWEVHPTSPWNYGLDLGATPPNRAFDVKRKPWPGNDMPFTLEGAPIELTTRGRRIPQWREDHLGLVGLLQPSPVRSAEPQETIRLVPMGAARLRITAFPVIGHGADAHEWAAPATPEGRVSASHCCESDTVVAVADRVLPKSSADRDIPRFTWWDHKGTKEWVQIEWEKARRVGVAEVYWFDDTAVGGGCGLPAACRVLYQTGGEPWTPVTESRTGPIARDGFTRIQFAPVETTALRLEVDLQPNRSAGILEWRVAEK